MTPFSTDIHGLGPFFARVLPGNPFNEGTFSGAFQNPSADERLTGILTQGPKFDLKRIEIKIKELGIENILVPNIPEHSIKTLGSLTELLKTFHPKSFKMGDLDRFHKEHSVSSFQLNTLLLHLGPKFVAENFGIGAVVWTLVNAPDIDYYRHNQFKINAQRLTDSDKKVLQTWSRNFTNLSNAFSSYLCNKNIGFDKTALDKCLGANKRWLSEEHGSRAQTFYKSYHLFRILREEQQNLNAITNFQDLLTNPFFHFKRDDPDLSGKPTFSTSEKNIGAYSIMFTTPVGSKDYGVTENVDRLIQGSVPIELRKSDSGSDIARYKIYGAFSDGPMGFCLNWKGIPMAIISFVVSDPGTLTIVQMQGVMGRFFEKNMDTGSIFETNERAGGRGLIGLRWRNLLLRLVENYAQANGFHRVQILGGKDNPWLGSDKGRHIFDASKASAYDHLASTMGYENKNGIWTLALKNRIRPDRIPKADKTKGSKETTVPGNLRRRRLAESGGTYPH
jgi:hypothetical protein